MPIEIYIRLLLHGITAITLAIRNHRKLKGAQHLVSIIGDNGIVLHSLNVRFGLCHFNDDLGTHTSIQCGWKLNESVFRCASIVSGVQAFDGIGNENSWFVSLCARGVQKTW